MLEKFIFLQKLVSLAHKTQHAVITHANTSLTCLMIWKSQLLFGKRWGMMLFLSNAPLKKCMHRYALTVIMAIFVFILRKFSFCHVLYFDYFTTMLRQFWARNIEMKIRLNTLTVDYHYTISSAQCNKDVGAIWPIFRRSFLCVCVCFVL